MQIELTGFQGLTHQVILEEIPRQCPFCSLAIHPVPIKGFYVLKPDRHSTTGIGIEVVFRCPKEDCGKVLIALYSGSYYNEKTHLMGVYPRMRGRIQFEPIISRISSGFCQIYEQSLKAELDGLDQVCGMGYRKALEFLIKDYLILLNPVERDKYIRTLLGPCIKDHVTDPNIKAMAERAVWLGNDETHYERKYQNTDISLLKELINLTQYWVLSNEKTRQYLQQITKV